MRLGRILVKEVWFVRHGESTGNVGMITGNVKDIELTDNGRLQAVEASSKIITQPDLIVATPYIRTQQTAEPTRTKFATTPFEIWDLQEFTFLDSNLCMNTTREQRVPYSNEYWAKNDPDFIHGFGTESFSNMTGRIKSVFNKIIERDENFTVIFTHGFILRTMITMLDNPTANLKELMEMVKPHTTAPKIANCEIIKTQFEGNEIKLLSKPKYGFE